MTNFKLKPLDIIITVTILTISAVMIIIFNTVNIGSSLTAVILQDSSEVKRINLNEVTGPYELEFDGYDDIHAVIYVQHGSISFKSSECPDKICVNTGILSEPNHSAVCLPARISVLILSDEN